MNDTYLGDGVYASFDGYHVVLDLRGQDNVTKIALEPAVLENLFAFAGFNKRDDGSLKKDDNPRE